MFWVMIWETLPRLDQLRHRQMAAIGLCRAEQLLHGETAAPGLAAHRLRGQEVFEIDRRHAVPHATGAAEIRNARFGGDAGAREHDSAAGVPEQAGEMLQLRFACRHDHAAGAKSQTKTQRSKSTMLALAAAKTESLGKIRSSFRRRS